MHVWFRRSGAGPEILNFRPSPGWCWCCWATDHTLWGAGHQPLLSQDWTANTLSHCKGPPPCGTLTSTCFSFARLNSHFSSLPDPMSSLPTYSAFWAEFLLTDLWSISSSLTPSVSHWRLSNVALSLPASALCQFTLSACEQAHLITVTSARIYPRGSWDQLYVLDFTQAWGT